MHDVLIDSLMPMDLAAAAPHTPPPARAFLAPAAVHRRAAPGWRPHLSAAISASGPRVFFEIAGALWIVGFALGVHAWYASKRQLPRRLATDDAASREHLETFLARRAEQDEPMPRFVIEGL